MKQTEHLTILKDSSDVIFNALKQYLIDTGAITSEYTDDMVLQYFKLYTNNLTQYTDKFIELYDTLVQLGVIYEGTPISDIPTIIENICEHTDPYILSYGKRIGNVVGKLRHTSDMWDDTSDLYNISTYLVGTRRYVFSTTDQLGVYSLIKGERTPTLLLDTIKVVDTIIEINDDEFYICGYDKSNYTMYVYYIVNDECHCVYEHTFPAFSSLDIRFYTIPDKEHCYFSAFTYDIKNTSSVVSSSCTGIYYVYKQELAQQIYGTTPYVNKNGYAWGNEFTDSLGNSYFSAFSGTGVLQSIKENIVHPINGMNSYAFTNFFETSKGDIYFWSDYNLVALCWLDPKTYEGASICYGRYWSLVESEDGGVYALTTRTTSANPGILKVNRSVYTYVVNTGQWQLFQDSVGTVYAKKDKENILYNVFPDRIEEFINLGTSTSNYSIKTMDNELHIFYAYSASGFNSNLPKALGIVIKNRTYYPIGEGTTSSKIFARSFTHDGYNYAYLDYGLYCFDKDYNMLSFEYTENDTHMTTYKYLQGGSIAHCVDGKGNLYVYLYYDSDYSKYGIWRHIKGNLCGAELMGFKYNKGYHIDDSGRVIVYRDYDYFTPTQDLIVMCDGKFSLWVPKNKEK